MKSASLFVTLTALAAFSTLALGYSGNGPVAPIKCEAESYSYLGRYVVEIFDKTAISEPLKSVAVKYEGFTGPDGDGEYCALTGATAKYLDRADSRNQLNYTFDGYVLRIKKNTGESVLMTPARRSYALKCRVQN